MIPVSKPFALILSCNETISEAATQGILRLVRGNDHLDYESCFTASTDAAQVARVATQVVVSRDPIEGAPNAAPYPWKGQAGLDFDPFVALEDDTDARTALQNCVTTVATRHVYGALIAVGEEAWLVYEGAQSNGQLLEDLLENGLVSQDCEAVRIGAMSADCAAEVGPLTARDLPTDGDFVVTRSTPVVLVGVPWWSEMKLSDANRQVLENTVASARRDLEEETPAPV